MKHACRRFLTTMRLRSVRRLDAVHWRCEHQPFMQRTYAECFALSYAAFVCVMNGVATGARLVTARV